LRKVFAGERRRCHEDLDGTPSARLFEAFEFMRPNLPVVALREKQTVVWERLASIRSRLRPGTTCLLNGADADTDSLPAKIPGLIGPDT